jgi:vitamin B12/bleomycin/antimicrobial peptide transport system ATP-binding/permease protein
MTKESFVTGLRSAVKTAIAFAKAFVVLALTAAIVALYYEATNEPDILKGQLSWLLESIHLFMNDPRNTLPVLGILIAKAIVLTFVASRLCAPIIAWAKKPGNLGKLWRLAKASANPGTWWRLARSAAIAGGAWYWRTVKPFAKPVLGNLFRFPLLGVLFAVAVFVGFAGWRLCISIFAWAKRSESLRRLCRLTLWAAIACGAWYWRTVKPIAWPVLWNVSRNLMKLISFGRIDLANVKVSGSAVAAMAWLLWGFLTSNEEWRICVPKIIRLPYWSFAGFRLRSPGTRPSWNRWGRLHWLLLVAAGAVFLHFAPGSAASLIHWPAQGLLPQDTPPTLADLFWFVPKMIWFNLGNWRFWLLPVPAIVLVQAAALIIQGLLSTLPEPVELFQIHSLSIVPPFAGRTLLLLREWCKAWLLLGLIALGTYVANAYIGKGMNELNGAAFNALQDKNATQFWIIMGAIAWMATFSVIFAPTYLIWKRWMVWSFNEYSTRTNLTKYTNPNVQGYYPIFLLNLNENTNERIETDLKTICTKLLVFLFTFLDTVVTLKVFGRILWDIEATLSFPLSVFRFTVIVNHLLLIVLIFYALLGTNGATWVGGRLRPLQVAQNKLTAFFRTFLVLFERNAEQIASYRGEAREYNLLWRRYKLSLTNNYVMLRWRWALGLFQGAYGQLASFLPLLTIAPFYFAGKTPLGTFSRSQDACGQVLGSLSTFIDQFEELMELLAAADRVNLLNVNLDKLAADKAAHRQRIQRIEDESCMLSFTGLTFYGLGNKLILQDFSLEVRRGQPVMLVGESGSGKTSVIRACAGLPLWDHGSGTIRIASRPKVMLLTQQAYMLSEGNLRDQLQYPNATDVSDDELIEVLRRVNLVDWMEGLTRKLLIQTIPDWDSLSEKEREGKLLSARTRWDLLAKAEQRRSLLQSTPNWTMELSGGERQRLVIARALVNKVDLVLADEATAGLDKKNEALLFRVMHDAGITTFNVSHGVELLDQHPVVVQLLNDGKGGTCIMTAAEYKALLQQNAEHSSSAKDRA